MKIKVCGLTDAGNAKGIAASSPDFMGFIFYRGSKRYVGECPPGSLFDIPGQIMKIGVFVNEELSIVIGKMKLWGLDLVQLHGGETPGYCYSLKAAGIRIIKAFGLDDSSDFDKPEKYTDVSDYFLFDTRTRLSGGSGVKFQWKKLEEYRLDKPFFLGGGIGPEDAGAIRKIQHENLFAIDINSRFETRPGIKDVEKVKNFINEIKA